MMIRTVLAVALVALAAPAAAQETDQAAIAAQKEAMKRFEWMHGAWRGPASGVTREGPYKITQTERIGPFLDGTVMVIEGRGYLPDGSTGFNALGVISYDARAKTYRMRSWALGHTGDFALTPTDSGYLWEIPAGPSATIRYTATFSGGTWTETGDYQAAGAPPRRIFEMNLKRLGDSGWPGAGAVAKD
jgi:hypothetical protein